MLASDSLAIINGALAVLLALGRHRKKLDPEIEEHLQNRLASLAQVGASFVVERNKGVRCVRACVFGVRWGLLARVTARSRKVARAHSHVFVLSTPRSLDLHVHDFAS